MHLTRADGILWFFLAIIVIWLQARTMVSPGKLFAFFGLCFMGYILVMGPWMLRNYLSSGAIITPGGGRALWLTTYDELYIYPSELLTFERWWELGLRSILGDRIWAVGQNLQTALAVQAGIVLAPLILVGVWYTRRDRRIQISVLAWLLTYFFMSIVFPYVGVRGGFFHSGAALQTVWWSIAPLGLEKTVRWVGGLRGWNLNQAGRFFQIGLIGLVLLISVLIFYSCVIGTNPAQPVWETNNDKYTKLDAILQKLGAEDRSIVMVNDFPGYFVASGRAAISIPYGDLETVLSVANRYGAHYLLLEIDQLIGEDNLYQAPGDHPGIIYIGSLDDTRIYSFMDP